MSKMPRPVTNVAGGGDFEEGPIRVYNNSGGTLARGDLVYVTGQHVASGLLTVAKADNDAAGKAAQWVILKQVTNNSIGVAGKRLRLTGVNTSSVTTAGDPVYLSATAGGWTATAPTGAGAIAQIVGVAEVKHASTGVIEFRLAASPTQIGTNEIQALAVTAPKLAANVRQRAVVQLTNAQVLALRATPITLVAAGGANTAILVEEVYLVADAAAGAYTESADNLAVEYADGTDILTIETTGWVDQAAVGARRARPAIALDTPVANSAVRLFNNGDGEFGGGNAANTLSVEVIYRVVSTVAFSS